MRKWFVKWITNFLNWKEWRRDVQLKKVGMIRVAPYGSRGRTHVPEEEPEIVSDGSMAARAKGQVKISARHYHADTGEWEDLGTLN